LYLIVFYHGIKTDNLSAIAEANTQNMEDNRLVSITFGSVQQIVPLQGADAVATETYWHTQDWLSKRNNAQARAHFQHYQK
jgi:hypothetical protein